MTETLLTTKIVHEAQQTLVASTGDNSWFLVLIAIAIISGIVVFKKKFVKVLLSFVLALSFVAFAPAKSYADQSVTITSIAEVSQDSPAELTITNNGQYPINIISFDITNIALPEDATWDINFNDNYQVKDEDDSENVSFDIAANSAFTFYVYPNFEDIPDGELCDICFKAVSTHYNGTYLNNDGGDNINVNYDFDFSYSIFETTDSTQVNRDVAAIEASFACIPNTYNNIILDNISYDVSDRIAFMRSLGFEDNIYCKLWKDQQPDFQADPGVSISTPTYTLDKNDVTSFCFNHKKIDFGSHDTEIINISVGATGADFEWASNFDFGAETDDYSKATGPHPEWINKEDHKGFDIAKNRLMYSYNSYYEKYIDQSPDVNKIILINGHSRGGAIANLLGRDFESDPAYKPFTYTFASPNTTTYTANKDYNTIYNILNLDDLVCQFPAYISGFCKYGQDIDLSVHDDISIDNTPMSTVFANKSGYGTYEGPSPDDVSALIEETRTIIENRNDAYTLNTESSKEYFKLGSYDTKEEAKAAIKKFKADIKTYNLNYYADVEDEPVYVELDDSWNIQFKCCVAFIMQDLTNLLFVYKDDYAGPFLGYNQELINIIIAAMGVAGGIPHGHVWMSYNVLARYDKY